MESLHFSIPEIFYLFGTFHGILLAIYLMVSRRRHRANVYLALLICLFSFYLFENTLYSSGYITRFPNFLYTSLPLIYLLAPLFYLYARSITRPERRIRLGDLIHLISFVFEIIILWSFYSLPTEIKLRVYDLTINSEPTFQFSIYFIGYLIYVFISCVYVRALSTFLRARKK